MQGDTRRFPQQQQQRAYRGANTLLSAAFGGTLGRVGCEEGKDGGWREGKREREKGREVLQEK